MIKFSIGIPAYKGIFFEECLTSILNQTYTNFELIIVNDASPDNLYDIVQKYPDTRIQYYENTKNIGAENVINNWNKCLQYATGDFFLLMGDDDKLSPSYLERFVTYILKYPMINVFHCRTAIINQNSEIINLSEGWPEWESMSDNIFHRIKDRRLQFISDFVYRTSFLKRIDGFIKFPLAWNSDDVTAFEAASDKGIVHINEILFFYRTNPYNISSNGNWYLKAEAMIQKEKWIKNKIQHYIPASNQEKIINQLILKELPYYIHFKLLQELSNGVKRFKIKNFIHIMRNSDQYHLTFRDYIRLFLICILK